MIFLLIVLQALAGLLRDAPFNLSHWMFAYEYYMSASMMPYIYERTKMPADKAKNWELTNKVFLWLSVIVPTAFAFMLWYDNFRNFKGLFNPIRDSQAGFLAFQIVKNLVYLI